MFELEIETLRLRLPGKSKERARSMAEKVGHGLYERLSSTAPLASKCIEDLRIELESGVTESGEELVERIVDDISANLKLS